MFKPKKKIYYAEDIFGSFSSHYSGGNSVSKLWLIALILLIAAFVLYSDKILPSIKYNGMSNVNYTGQNNTSLTDSIYNVTNLEMQVHELINQERQNAGLPELRWNERLGRIANDHSLDMADRNYFDHVSPEGYDVDYRYNQAGFRCMTSTGENTYLTGGENIYYSSGSAFFMQATVREIVSGWMNSPGHRSNILNPYWQSEGIGIAISSGGSIYVTENFC